MVLSKSNLLLTSISVFAAVLVVYLIILRKKTSTQNITDAELNALKKRIQLMTTILSCVIVFGGFLFLFTKNAPQDPEDTIITFVDDSANQSAEPSTTSSSATFLTQDDYLRNKKLFLSQNMFSRLDNLRKMIPSTITTAQDADDAIKQWNGFMREVQEMDMFYPYVYEKYNKEVLEDLRKQSAVLRAQEREQSGIIKTIDRIGTSITQKVFDKMLGTIAPSSENNYWKPKPKPKPMPDSEIENVPMRNATKEDNVLGIYFDKNSKCYQLSDSQGKYMDIAQTTFTPQIKYKHNPKTLAYYETLDQIDPINKIKTEVQMDDCIDESLYICDNGFTEYVGNNVRNKELNYLGCRENTNSEEIVLLQRKQQTAK